MRVSTVSTRRYSSSGRLKNSNEANGKMFQHFNSSRPIFTNIAAMFLGIYSLFSNEKFVVFNKPTQILRNSQFNRKKKNVIKKTTDPAIAVIALLAAKPVRACLVDKYHWHSRVIRTWLELFHNLFRYPTVLKNTPNKQSIETVNWHLKFVVLFENYSYSVY